MITQEAKLQYQLGWERIFGKQTPRGAIYYLPTETAATIIQYDPDFRISVLIPPAKRKLQIDYRSRRLLRDHQTPFLLLSHLTYLRSLCDPGLIYPKVTEEIYQTIKHFPWCYCDYCARVDYRSLRTVNSFYLWAVNTSTENAILAQPYRINNVYPDAKCCFKKTNDIWSEPRNLKQAHARFWMDYFSDEFQPFHGLGYYAHQCLNKEHSFPPRHYNSENDLSLGVVPGCLCACCNKKCQCGCCCPPQDIFADWIANYIPNAIYENYTRVVCGDQFISHSKPTEAIFVSTDQELLKSIPETFHKKSAKHQTTFLLGLANLVEGQWEIDLIGLNFTLNPRQVMVLE